MTQSSTRARLIRAATRLFSEHGFRGASVRDICNLARSNPGAISYHFGGKRQLYRVVLRQAAERLASLGAGSEDEEPASFATRVESTMGRLLGEMERDPAPARLLLRDLADGGSVALEALAPTLRTTLAALRTASGHGDSPRATSVARLLFLELASPLFLIMVGWPVIVGTLELNPTQRDAVFMKLVKAAVDRHTS
jgi:AcrR family transcriptional regulator